MKNIQTYFPSKRVIITRFEKKKNHLQKLTKTTSNTVCDFFELKNLNIRNIFRIICGILVRLCVKKIKNYIKTCFPKICDLGSNTFWKQTPYVMISIFYSIKNKRCRCSSQTSDRSKRWFKRFKKKKKTTYPKRVRE